MIKSNTFPILTTWLNALRSGEYKQAQNRLRVNDSFCCLGVACDLYDKSSWCRFNDAKYCYLPKDRTLDKGQYGTNLPGVILRDFTEELRGTNLHEGQVKAQLTGIVLSVMKMNDERKTFIQIADFLQRGFHNINPDFPPLD